MRADVPFLIAFRQSRKGFLRLGGAMLAVALGIGALTGIHAFQADAARGASAEARTLLGGDIRVEAPAPLGPEVEALLDTLESQGARVSRSISLGTMVSTPDGATARLLQLYAIDNAFPSAGEPVTENPETLGRFRAGEGLLGEAPTFRGLGVEAGDSLRIGGRSFEVLGTVTGMPIDPGLRTLVGPPVFMGLEALQEADLLHEGSLARYRAHLTLAEGASVPVVAAALESRLSGGGPEGPTVRTADEQAQAVAEGFTALARFLGLVGFMALLLGGAGVASAVHAHVEAERIGIAVLRCLGAGQGALLAGYLLQAGVVGAGGALLGTGLGVALQFSLPGLLEGVLPVTFEPALHPGSIALGLGVGTGIAILFALPSLLRVREISPLAALRIEVEPGEGRRGHARLAAGSAVLFLMVLLAAVQTGGWGQGLVLTGGIGAVLLVLFGASHLLVRLLRSIVPDAAPHPIRQGISGLFRPGNRTGLMVTSLGFGTFLIAALLVVAGGLGEWLEFEMDDDVPSLLLFDIQDDQREGVEALLQAEGARPELLPIVPGRIVEIDGRDVDVLADEGEIPGWTLRRLYRNTSTPDLREGEVLVSGAWWEETSSDPGEGVVRISVDEGLAGDLGLEIGSRVVWDVQGRRVPSVVTSLRRVDWGRFQPNFFVVFEPGALDGAPTTWIGLARGRVEEDGAGLREALLDAYPNVSFLELATLRDTLARISAQLAGLLGAMALFALFGGILVMAATLLQSREARRREYALLRVLGAGAGTVRGGMLVEYAVLGFTSAALGIVTGIAGGGALLHWGFGVALVIPGLQLLGLGAFLLLLTLVIGWSTGGSLLRHPSRPILAGEVG